MYRPNKYYYTSCFTERNKVQPATLTTHLYRIREEQGATSNIPLPADFMNMDLKGGTFPDDLQLSGDVQYILILNSDEEWIDTLLWQTKDAPEWTRKVYDLSKYSGSTIWLHYGTYNDGEDGVTNLVALDIILLLVDYPPASHLQPDSGNMMQRTVG